MSSSADSASIPIDEATFFTIVAGVSDAGRPRDEEGPQVRGHSRLELIWTVIPMVILAGIISFVFYKLPGIAETLDWTRALMALGEHELSEGALEATLGSIVKYQEDLARLRGEHARQLLARAVNA